nr:MAG TPA: DnaB-like replicative helicase [Caudoviricetes sp.]
MGMRALPNNPEAERALLSSIINNKNTLEKVKNKLRTDDFYIDKHKKLYGVICEMYDNEISIDLVTLLEYINSKKLVEKCGTISYVTEIATNNFYTDNITEYINIIKSKAARRKLINIAKELALDAYEKEDMDINNSINKAEDGLYKIAKDKDTGDIISISTALENAFETIEENYLNGGQILGETTGFDNIDKVICGLNKGDFIVIAARPSMGKTAFALNIAQYAAKNASVAVFSLEMGTQALTERLIAARCLIDYEKIKTGKVTPEEFTKITNNTAELSKRKLYIDDGAFTLSDIKAKCTNLKIKYGLDVIIIDYLQLIEGSNKNVYSREQEISKISRELKKLAKKLDITVIALSQLSRAPEQRADHRPILADLRESGAIEQDADIIMMLYRDEYYNADSEDKNIAEVIINKNRNGEVKTLKLAWVGKYQRFAPLDVRG